MHHLDRHSFVTFPWFDSESAMQRAVDCNNEEGVAVMTSTALPIGADEELASSGFGAQEPEMTLIVTRGEEGAVMGEEEVNLKAKECDKM